MVVRLFKGYSAVNLTHMGYIQDRITNSLPTSDPSLKQAPCWQAHNRVTEEKANIHTMIISFSSPSSLTLVSHRLGTGASEDEGVVHMDDDDEFGTENAKITSPGESITSARAFMR